MQTMAPNWLPDSLYVAKFMLTTHDRSDLEHLRDRCGSVGAYNALAIRDGLEALGIGLRAIGRAVTT